MQKFPV